MPKNKIFKKVTCVCYRSRDRGVCEPVDASASQLPPAGQRPRDEDEHLHNACQVATRCTQHTGFPGVRGTHTRTLYTHLHPDTHTHTHRVQVILWNKGIVSVKQKLLHVLCWTETHTTAKLLVNCPSTISSLHDVTLSFKLSQLLQFG